VRLTVEVSWTGQHAPAGSATFTVDGAAFPDNRAVLSLAHCGAVKLCAAQASVFYPAGAAAGTHRVTATVTPEDGSFAETTQQGSFTVMPVDAEGAGDGRSWQYADRYRIGNGAGGPEAAIASFMALQAGGAGNGFTAEISPSYPYFTAAREQPLSSYEEPAGYYYTGATGKGCWGTLPGSGNGDFCGNAWPVNSHLLDPRDGSMIESFNNPVNRFGGIGSNYRLDYPGGSSSDGGTGFTRLTTYDVDYGNSQLIAESHQVHQFAGGHNTNYGSGWGKSNLALGVDRAVYFSQGQHSIRPMQEYCLGLGDCMGSPVQITFATGLAENSDEGIHHGDQVIAEDGHVFAGPCADDREDGASCRRGSTLLLACGGGANAACANSRGGHGQGDQGDGRMAIDLSRASCGTAPGCKVVDGLGAGNRITGQLGAGPGESSPPQFVAPQGTFPPSTAIARTKAAIVAAKGQGEPGRITVPIEVSQGHLVPGIACIYTQLRYEQVEIAGPGADSMTASFRKGYPAGALITQGGTCGWGLAFNVDTRRAYDTVRMLIPLIGSPDSAHAYYSLFSRQTYSGSAVFNHATASATYDAESRLVRVSCPDCAFGGEAVLGNKMWGDADGSTFTISGSSDGAYNTENAVIKTASYNSFTYGLPPGAAPTQKHVEGLTITQCACSFTLYPRAEVLSVYNQDTKSVDGTLALEPNSVDWRAGDMVEEPHWHAPAVNDSHDTVLTYTPQAQVWGRGFSYAGRVSGNLYGFSIHNNAGEGHDGHDMSQYQGYGGQDAAPSAAQLISGWWGSSFIIGNAPDESVFDIGCKPDYPGTRNGCTRWNSSYMLFRLHARAGDMQTIVDPDKENLIFKNTLQCSSLIGSSVASVGAAKYGGVSVEGGPDCGLFSPALVLGSATVPVTRQTGTGAGLVTDVAPTIRDATLSGTTRIEHLSSWNGGSKVSVACGAGAGAGAVCTLSATSTDTDGRVTVTAAARPAPSGIVMTLTFGRPFSGEAVCLWQPATASAVQAAYSPADKATASTLVSAGQGLTAGSVYAWKYHCAN
jgi:hypothetical protein